MTLYYYDISGDHPYRDDDGTEHAGDRAAWRDAVKLVRDVEDHLRPNGKWVLTVRSGDRIVFVIDVTATSNLIG